MSTIKSFPRDEQDKSRRLRLLPEVFFFSFLQEMSTPKLRTTRRAASLRMKGQSTGTDSQNSSGDSTPGSAEPPKKSNWQVIEHFAEDCTTHSPNLIAVSILENISQTKISLFTPSRLSRNIKKNYATKVSFFLMFFRFFLFKSTS